MKMPNPLPGGHMLRLKRALPFALTLVAVGLVDRPASAQQRLFYMDRAQISGAPDDGYMVWRPHLYEKTRFYGMATLGFMYNPLHAETVTKDPAVARDIDNPVETQVVTYLQIGTQVAHWFGVNLSLPVGLFASYGDSPDGGDNNVDFNASEKTGLYDMRFDARIRAYESKDKLAGLGVGTAVFVDTGNSAGLVASDGATTAYLFGSGEYDFGDFLLAGTLGPHFRPQHSITEGTRSTISLGVRNELRWAFGAYVPLKDSRIRLGLELWGSTGMGSLTDGTNTTFAKRNTDLEWLAQAKLKLDKKGQWWAMGGLGTRLLTAGYGSPDLRLLASIGYWFTLKDGKPNAPPPRYEQLPDVVEKEADRDGDGYPDSIDKCPDIKEDGREPNPTDGCPGDADRDGDGIPDSRDACPDVKEDMDGVADTDGCPESDADNDGIPDGEDKCPNEPGPAATLAEKNGCPSLTRFTDDGEIQLLEPIQFETGKSTIKPVSFPILDEVVSLLKARKDLNIGVYGHTDSVGSDAMNLTLSKNRAAACVKYLVEKGIAASRLISEGFGETKPVDTNDTVEGRAKNRRTEFKVVD